MSDNEIRDAIKKVAAAKEALQQVVATTYPVGAEVRWRKRGHRQLGSVKSHGGTGRAGQLRVENMYTHKTYWITMYDVLGYVEH